MTVVESEKGYATFNGRDLVGSRGNIDDSNNILKIIMRKRDKKGVLKGNKG